MKLYRELCRRWVCGLGDFPHKVRLEQRVEESKEM